MSTVFYNEKIVMGDRKQVQDLRKTTEVEEEEVIGDEFCLLSTFLLLVSFVFHPSVFLALGGT